MLRGFRNKIVSIMVLALMCLSYTAFPQYDKYKALYIYNFVKLIDWPVNESEQEFVIGIIGDQEVESELARITKDKKVIDRDIKVVRVNAGDDMSGLEVLFIAKSSADRTFDLINKLNGKPVLLITEHKRTKAAINFVEDETSLLFEIDPGAIERQGLKVSKTLIELGIVTEQ